MEQAIAHFNHRCIGIAHLLSLQELGEHPVGEIVSDERSVSYAVTQRDGEPVLAYLLGPENPVWDGETYCEVTARGFVIFRCCSWRRRSVIGEPFDSTIFYENEVQWLSRAASAGIPGTTERLAATMEVQSAHIAKYGKLRCTILL